MQALQDKRDRNVERLGELAEKMLVGSASETYRTCGNPNCRCHSTGPKHGPHMYVSYKGESGRSTGYYVPVAFHQDVREGLKAWKEFQALAKEVAELNKDIMHAKKEAAKKKRKEKE